MNKNPCKREMEDNIKVKCQCIGWQMEDIIKVNCQCVGWQMEDNIKANCQCIEWQMENNIIQTLRLYDTHISWSGQQARPGLM